MDLRYRNWASAISASVREIIPAPRGRRSRPQHMSSARFGGSKASQAYWFDILETRSMLSVTPDSDFVFSSGVISSYAGSGGEVVIPSMIGGQAVTGIGENAFYYADVTSVVIPNGVTSIGRWAFGGAPLRSVAIPSTVTSIGGYAFFDCEYLSTVTIPNSVTSIEESTFSWCTSLTNITIPNSITRIGDGAFYVASSLRSVTIPGSVTSIGQAAFRKASSLTSVTFKGNAPTIGVDTFADVAPGAQAYRAPGLTGYGTVGDNFHGLIVANAHEAPTPPRSVLGGAGNGQVTLSWTPPLSDGGSAVVDYVIRFSSDGGVTWTRFIDTVSSSPSATVTGLTNGTRYVFKVSAVNVAGMSLPSTNSLPVKPKTAPSSPTNVVGIAGTGQVSLSWTPPASNGGGAIVDYVIRYSTNGGVTWKKFVDAVSSLPSASVIGLTSGAAYVFKVSAVNVAGTSLPSAKSLAVTPK